MPSGLYVSGRKAWGQFHYIHLTPHIGCQGPSDSGKREKMRLKAYFGLFY